jgi:hypothetical protein
MEEWAQEFGLRLLASTYGCREDMHEPDEQNVKAHVIGYKLDNACGDAIIEGAIVDGWQELVVIIDQNGHKEAFNLACIIALARQAAKTYQI